MTQPQLVVMAAGIGSRYGGLKQIDPIGPSGEIVIDYSIYDAIRAGFEKVVFIIRKEIEDTFRDKIGKTVEKQIETAYVLQELDNLPAGVTPPADRTKPWGTAQAVLCARDAIDAPFAAINADDFYGRSSFQALGDHLRSAQNTGGVMDFSMVGFILANTLTEHGHVARGVCTAGEDNYLASIVERTRIQTFDKSVRFTEDGDNWTDLPSDSIVSMNMWGFTTSIFDAIESYFVRFLAENIGDLKAECYLPSVVDELIQAGVARAKILHTDEKWIGVTYPQDKPIVKEAIGKLVAAGDYPEKLWK